ncbi:hypothetical protein WG936_08270 [Corynebacterium sp. H127]|uniref:hypothetical protein n=1 Tax=Corynebacterium sp. H127 TaxID=3133418 RepID=UPI0030A6FA8D
MSIFFIMIASLAANRVFTHGAKEQTKQNDSDARAQVLLDTFTGEIAKLKSQMEAGFAERDARLDDFEKKYHAALGHIRDWRRHFPAASLPAPTEIEADL